MEKGIYILCFLSLWSCITASERVVRECSNPEVRLLFELSAEEKKLVRHVDFLVANMPYKQDFSDNEKAVYYNAFIDSLEQAHKDNPTVDFSQTQVPDNGKRGFSVSYDLDRILAESLLSDIRLAQQIWQQTPWTEMYPESTFMEYVLPYRICDETPDYTWRSLAYSDYQSYLDSKTDPLSLCCKIEHELGFRIYAAFRSAGLRSYSDYKLGRRGSCDDQCLYTAMIMRSVGLPVSFDIIPQWGSHNLGHSLNALLLPSGESVGFNTMEDLENGLELAHKVPKIFRRTYKIQRETSLYRFRETEYIPDFFSRFDLIDVTSEYQIPAVDIRIPMVAGKSKRRLGFLAVPDRYNWQIVAWGERRGSRVCFRDIGTDYNAGQIASLKGENIGEGIVYLPVVADEAGQYPVNVPFVLTQEGVPRYLAADMSNCQNIELYRKYPRLERIVNFAKTLELCVLEGANLPDFSDAEILHIITDTPGSHMQIFDLYDRNEYQYVRLMKRNGGFSLADLVFFDSSGERLPGVITASKAIADEPTLKYISDGEPLTYFHCSGGFKDLWVGFEFDKPEHIASIGICPRTDDNDISPGDTYELFYWDGEWVSLGRQTAIDYKLNYDDVPSNALLFLRNLTKGQEERPFTYENGMQIWW